MRQICYVNESSALSDAEIATYIAAYVEDINQYGSLWSLGQVTLRQVPKGDPPLAGWEQMVFLDDSDQANALGHHEQTIEGLPLGKIFVNTTTQYGETVSRVGSHETWEQLVDPDLNRYAPAVSDGREFCIEVGDLLSLDTQGRTLPGSQIMLSGIALPATYYAGYGNRYDIGGILTAPLPNVQPGDGAYLMWRGGASWAPATLPPHPGSRRHRRMMGLANWRRSTVAVA